MEKVNEQQGMSENQKRLLQEALEMLEEQALHIEAPMLPAGEELLNRIRAAISHQAEPVRAQSYKDDPRTAAELSAAGCRCVRFGEGNPHWPCRIHAAPAQDEREAVDTVPRWKFHALVEHCKKQDQLISDLYARLNSVRLYDEKEVWFWQGDGCDHLESLSCPIVIEADELRRLVNAAPIAQPAPAGDERGHDTKGSRKALGAMNAKLRAKVGRLERELAALLASDGQEQPQ